VGNFKESLLEKQKLAPHAYGEGPEVVGSDEARILETESKSRYRK
jgi:hypothetical protein